MSELGKEAERLKQTSFLQLLNRMIRPSEMLTVCSSHYGEERSFGTYCALIPNSMTAQSLKSDNWDLSKNDGFPGAISSYSDGVEVTEYSRFGQFESGIEPLVLFHEFYGMRDGYVEITEEFRTFHRLYHDRRTNKFWKFDLDGNEEVVAEIVERTVKIRFREIREFLAVKDMHLALLFDSLEFSSFRLNDLGLEDSMICENEELVSYNLAIRDLESSIVNNDRQSISRFLGKRLLPPMDKAKVPFLGYSPKKEYPEFLLDVDEDDNEIRFTCNPDELGNYFGGKPAAPSYLTPVQFRKSVLDNYYAKPTKYEITDSHLSCAGLWGLTIDNHHDDHVVVWLGDLGTSLPESDWAHWLSHNEPRTIDVSDPFFRRQILGQWAGSDSTEHRFFQRYAELARESESRLGWPLFLSLAEGDRHFLQSIRVPSNDEQKTFDELILSLTKVLVDSLNEKEIKKLLPGESKDVGNGISLLQSVLGNRLPTDHEEHITLMRDIQELRSSGTAHRKGRKYERLKKMLGIDERPLREVFRDLLQQSLALLDFLLDSLHVGAFDTEDTRPERESN